MSTILDSLKKSSQSRGDNDKASINSFSFSDNSQTKKSNPLVLLIILLITAGILYFGYQYLYPNSFETGMVTDVTDNSNQPIDEVQDDSEQTIISLATESKDKRIEKPNSSEVKKVLQNKITENSKITQNTSDSKVKAKPDVTAKLNNNFKDLNKPLTNTVSATAIEQNHIKHIKTTDKKLQTNTNRQQSTIQSFKLAYQLPFSIRKDLPELILNIHVYDKNPQNRIAIINGEKFEVDALIDDEVLVKEIVLEGVVLEFKNETFLLPKL